MVTATYPLTVQQDYTELRYSLRSLEKCLTPPFEVIIISDHVPEWINNVTVIELPDVKGKKQWSIRRKILAALEYAEEILFLNDDCYFLQPVNEFPYYWHGELKKNPEAGAKPLLKELEKKVLPTRNFDGHYPLIYEADAFKYVSQQFTEDCIIKSMYCNYFEVRGTFTPDCKLLTAKKPEEIRNFIKDLPCFSTGVNSLKSALSILHELFPEPSKYEI